MLKFRIKDQSLKSSENPSYRRWPFMAKLALFSSVFLLPGVKWGFGRLWGQNFKGVILGLYIWVFVLLEWVVIMSIVVDFEFGP